MKSSSDTAAVCGDLFFTGLFCGDLFFTGLSLFSVVLGVAARGVAEGARGV